MDQQIIHFVVWLLFKRTSLSQKPQHLLCHGFSRNREHGIRGTDTAPLSSIPGLYTVKSRANINTLKRPEWTHLLSMLKGGGDKIMIDLLLDCSIFQYTKANNNSLLQISGIPISVPAARATSKMASNDALDPTKADNHILMPPPPSRSVKLGSLQVRSPATIQFVRSRMLYGKPKLNARGVNFFGLPHVHVFRRLSKTNNEAETVRIMKYMFPHTFKLHNPFTSDVDRRETSMKFKDYTTREQEIMYANLKLHPNVRDRIPHRLTTVADVVRQIRKRERDFPYGSPLHRHCPSKLDNIAVPEPNAADGVKRVMTDFATPHADVARFCKAVMAGLLPDDCLGSADGAIVPPNWISFSRFIDSFVRLRRTETLSLQDLCQPMTLTAFKWLCPPGMDPAAKLSNTDFGFRTLLMWQFFYFVVDSILMPLIRSHFYVTESSGDRHQLFYFRHDVWTQLTEPKFKRMISGRLFDLPEKEPPVLVQALAAELQSASTPNSLGPSKLRLVPKPDDFRIICNLGHRQPIKKGGKFVLSKSTNSKLLSVHHAMKAETYRDSSRLGSSLSNRGDIGPRLEQYKQQLQQIGWKPGQKLYYAKVDIQSCFDSIPQDKALDLLNKIMVADAYQILRYADVSPPHSFQLAGSESSKLRTKYANHATALSTEHEADTTTIDLPLAPCTVRTPVAPADEVKLGRLRELLREHVLEHRVKIGKKEYQQTQGIPQGSVVSTLLCNFFYAEFERIVLHYIRRPDTIMMRLVDDFLVISTDRVTVGRFMNNMQEGDRDWGITVKASKTDDNLSSDQNYIAYCGLGIKIKTLEIFKRPGAGDLGDVFNSLTVDHGLEAGKKFHQKTLK